MANRLLKRVRDYVQVMADGMVTQSLAVEALYKLEVDHIGLDEVNHNVLRTIIDKFNCCPVGRATISAFILSESDTLLDVYDSYLLHLRFLS